MNRIFFDLDGVICKTYLNDYKKSRKIQASVKIINKLYDKGFWICIYTSRFMGRSNEKIYLAKKKGYNFTKKQLKSWGVKYHLLKFGKPSYDLFIDDKTLFFKKNWQKELIKILKINDIH